MRRFLLLGFLCSSVAWGTAPWGSEGAMKQIGFDQKVGAQVPLDLTFRDESGTPVPLKQFFVGKPVVLNLVYYRCPMLCTEVLNGLTRAMRTMKLQVGNDYNVVTLSIDPRETAVLAAKKGKLYRLQYERPATPLTWPFLAGDEESIRRVAEAVGFRFAYDQESDQYGHAAGVVVLTSTGKVSRYLLGIEYSPKDLRFALIEAAQGAIGNAVDQAILYCYLYDPLTGKYGLSIMRLVRAGGLLTLLALAGFVMVSIRKEKYA